MDKTCDLSEIKVNYSTLFFTGDPLLILNLSGKRVCKLLLSNPEDVKLLSLVYQNKHANVLDDEKIEKLLKWVDEGIIIKESSHDKEEGKSKNPFLSLFREFSSAAHLTRHQHSLVDYHREGITDPGKQFEDEEITLSHVYRLSHPALKGLSYGARFAEVCCEKGVLKKGANILEVGCGIGYFGNAFLSYLKERFPDIYNTIHYTFFDLSPVLLSSQKETNISHEKITSFIEGNIENYDFGHSRFDLVISNEMIADLGVAKLKKNYFFSDETPPESLTETVAFCKRCNLNFEDAFEEFLINTGAFNFITKLKEILSSDGNAIVVEYGDIHLYPHASELSAHTEFSIHFGHLIEVAKVLGFNTEFSNMVDFLGFNENEKVLDYLSFIALKEHLLPFFNRSISQLAYTEESLGRAIGEEFLARIHGLHFANISEASATVNPQSFRVLIISKA